MKIEIKNTLKLFTFLLCLMPVLVWAADYTVGTGTTTVDGDTFCGGSACTSSDTIVIEGGNRGHLLLQDFDGSGSYIHIVNQNINPDSRVEINGVLQLHNCKYVDVGGNNDPNLTYGIKVLNDAIPDPGPNSVRIKGQSDHIKISYIEVAFNGNTSTTGNGIFVQDCAESSSWIWDTIEIHHNYIHGSRYAGMYLGQNDPGTNDNPYLANVSVHDNIINDSGSYGMNLMGIHSSSGVCTIYNNTVDTTGLVYEDPDSSGHQGISVQYFAGSTYANIYNNTVINTKGAGIRISHEYHNVYDNKVLGCGTSNNTKYGHGIVTRYKADGVNIYDNIIIQPTRYGIYALYGADVNSTTLSRNLIGDAGIGEWGEESSGRIIESSGADANIYHADVAIFGFNAWSDDDDYSNDDFEFISIAKPTRLRVVKKP